MSDERLIVFVKAPRPGTVKTRLALGPAAECVAYQRLVTTLLAQLTRIDDAELRFSPAEAQMEIQPWLKTGWLAAPQGNGDLGERLQNAFADAFRSGAKRVVVIGSDCPDVTAGDIRDAWRQLQICDAVLGPARDGGYWLIGLREPQPALFANIPWSSEQVLTQTLARAKSLGLRIHLLRTLSDVDTKEDWLRFISAATRGRPPRQSPGAD